MTSTRFLGFKTHFQSVFKSHGLKVRLTLINYRRNQSCILLPRATPTCITTVYRSPFQHMSSNEFYSHRRLESARILFISDTGQHSPEAGFPDIQEDGALTDQETVERFTPTADAIMSAFTSCSVTSSPPQSAGWEPFRAYWHDILTQVMKEVEANPNIPYFLSDPPFKKFNVHLYRVDDNTGIAKCCCCLEGGLPNIRIINQNGVTKGELVPAVRDHFYGEGLEQTRRVWTHQEDENNIYDEDGSCLVRVRGPVILGKDWLEPAWRNEEDEARGSKCMNWDRGAIYLYVCEAEEFKAKIKARQEEIHGFEKDDLK